MRTVIINAMNNNIETATNDVIVIKSEDSEKDINKNLATARRMRPDKILILTKERKYTEFEWCMRDTPKRERKQWEKLRKTDILDRLLDIEHLLYYGIDKNSDLLNEGYKELKELIEKLHKDIER